VLGRVKIGFTRAKADDVLAVSLHLFGLGINGQSQRGRQRGGSMANLVVHSGADRYCVWWVSASGIGD